MLPKSRCCNFVFKIVYTLFPILFIACASLDLYNAAYEGNIEKVKSLLDGNADVNADVNQGATALFAAAQSGHIEIVRLLLVSGANVDAKFKDYVTPLMASLNNKHYDVAELLIANGADVNSKSDQFGSALHAASINGQVETVRFLLANGADVDSKGGNQFTPLMCASFVGHYEVAELLIFGGADVNAKADQGETSLHFASLKNHVEVFKLLLANGADINTQQKLGATALYFASENGHVEIVKLLLTNGADAQLKYKNLFMPLDVALLNNRLDVAECLINHDEKPNINENNPDSLLAAAFTFEIAARGEQKQNFKDNALEHYTNAVNYYKKAKQKYTELANDLNAMIVSKKTTENQSFFAETFAQTLTSYEAKYQSRQFGQMGKLQNQASKALGYKDHLKKIREQGKSYQQYTEANYENKKILIDLYAKKAELSHRQSLKCTLIIECYNSKISNDELTKCTEKANLY